MEAKASLLLFFLLAWSPLAARGADFNLVSFGAKAGGTVDASQALLKTWDAAVKSAGAANIIIPQGKFLVSKAVTLSGAGAKATSINIKFTGTLVGPADYKVLGNTVHWLHFHTTKKLTITGGTVDGQGSSLWSCKKKPGSKCPFGATMMMFTNSNDLVLSGVTAINSPLYHIAFNQCKNVKLTGTTIKSPKDANNTDGIHVQKSSDVTILKSNVAAGDDCVSIGEGTINLWIEDFKCGPGHGISVGSLGKSNKEGPVRNVTVKTATFTGTMFGARIKAWANPNANGIVQKVVYEHLTMVNVETPVIIDQHYCPEKNCAKKESTVKISDVTMQDIHGSSAFETSVSLDCSAKNPCLNVKLGNIKLTYKNGKSKAVCHNVKGTAIGQLDPPSCLNK